MVLSFAKPIEKSASCDPTAGINDVISGMRLPELYVKVIGASHDARPPLRFRALVRSKAFQDVLVWSNYDIEETIKLKSITRLHFSGGRSTPTKNR